MSPNIPRPLTLEARIGVEHDMIYHDPDHRKNTQQHVGHEPTDTDLVRRWFETDASQKLHALFESAVQTSQQNGS